MGDVIDLQQNQLTQLKDNIEFVSDCCRFRENILSEAAVKKKWKFDAATWEKLGDDDELVRAIEAEGVRRIRTGQQKRERAQVLVTAAPDVVSAIMLDSAQNSRHRLDAAASLNKFAANPSDSTPAAASERFVITINLGADLNGNPIIEKYDKSISINADDVAPNDIGGAPQSRCVLHSRRCGLCPRHPVLTAG